MILKRILLSAITVAIFFSNINSQVIEFEGKEFTLNNVFATVADMNGEQVLKVERDLEKLPFDIERLETTVDEPTYVRLNNLDFENGTIEVKMYSDIQDPSPFSRSRRFYRGCFSN